jgi:peptide/nickel transport system permease protein
MQAEPRHHSAHPPEPCVAEASLSFLGLGIQPPDTSWGLDIATGRTYIFNAWWLVTFPGILIALTVLCTNLVAGWFRVVADPQERDKRFTPDSDVSGVV